MVPRNSANSAELTDPTNGFQMTSIAKESHAQAQARAAAARQPAGPSGIPSEAEMGRAIAKGWKFGVPGLFAIITVIALLAGASPLQAAGIAAFPSIVCGGFLTSSIFIGLAAAKASH